MRVGEEQEGGDEEKGAGSGERLRSKEAPISRECALATRRGWRRSRVLTIRDYDRESESGFSSTTRHLCMRRAEGHDGRGAHALAFPLEWQEVRLGGNKVEEMLSAHLQWLYLRDVSRKPPVSAKSA